MNAEIDRLRCELAVFKELYAWTSQVIEKYVEEVRELKEKVGGFQARDYAHARARASLERDNRSLTQRLRDARMMLEGV